MSMRYRVSPWQRALVACYAGYYLVWTSIVVVVLKALEEMMVLYSDAESLTSVSEALDIVGSVFLGHGLLLGL